MKTRVLVVDDDHLVADTLSMIFNANGYECEALYSAADAFERAKEFIPALVLCDVVMPEESGIQLAWRVQDHLPQTRVLMLTGYGVPTPPAEAEVGQGSRPTPPTLRKPCRPDDLLRESRRLLQSA